MTTTRMLPHSIDAERALLGSMLLHYDAIGDAIGVLGADGAEAFFFPSHAELYAEILRMYDARKPLDGVLIMESMRASGVLEKLGGMAFLGELVGSVASHMRAAQYAAVVRDKHLLRRAIQAAHRISERCYADDGPAQDTLNYVEQELFAATARRIACVETKIDPLIVGIMDDLRNRDGGAMPGILTGWHELDTILGGLRKQELVVVAGRPSMGKTAFLLGMIENTTIVGGRGAALFFSLEMSRNEIANRLLCSVGQVDSRRLRRGVPLRDDVARLEEAARMIEGARFVIDDTGGLGILELRAKARLYQRRHGADLIFVDYLQLLTARRAARENRQAEVAEISRQLKALAKELDVPVIAAAQLNREVETQRGSVPKMSNLRESGAIEQDADVVILLHRPNYYDAQAKGAAGESSIIVEKNRNGPVGIASLWFNPTYARFSSQNESAYAQPAETAKPSVAGGGVEQVFPFNEASPF